MIEYILQHIQHIGYWAYPALFIAMAFEGDLVLLTTGFFIRMGVLDPLWTTIALLGGTLLEIMVGILSEDILDISDGSGSKNSMSQRNSQKSILYESLPILFVSQNSSTDFIDQSVSDVALFMFHEKIFIEANIAASIIWILVVAGIGYLAGASFMAARHYLKFAEIGIIVIILLIVGIMHFVSKKFKKDDLLK